MQLQALGRLDDAASCFRRALELKPDFVEAQFNLGNALQAQGRLDDAVACYRRAVELKPEYVVGHNNLGSVRMPREGWTKRSPATAGPRI